MLMRFAKPYTTSIRLVRWAHTVLHAAIGESSEAIAMALGVWRIQAERWRERYASGGLATIKQYRQLAGRPSRADASEVARCATQTATKGVRHWSARMLDAMVWVCDTTVLRVWRILGLKLLLIKSFKVPRDLLSVEKLEDIIGLYRNLPEHAPVLCCDEKSQVRAMGKTQPGLPIEKGLADTMIHNYEHHGTTTVCSTPRILDNQVIGQHQKCHCHAKPLPLLPPIGLGAQKDKKFYLVCGNNAAHKYLDMQDWLSKNLQFHKLFTPISPSWLSMVKRFFRHIAIERSHRNIFRSVSELTAEIEKYIIMHKVARYIRNTIVMRAKITVVTSAFSTKRVPGWNRQKVRRRTWCYPTFRVTFSLSWEAL